MPILFDEGIRTFTLNTENSTYQMGIGKYDFLLHYYYGDKVENQNLSYLIQYYDRGFSGNPYETGLDRTFSQDTLPLEISTFGLGDYRESCIDIQNTDGSIALDLRYLSHKIYSGKYKTDGLPHVYGEDADADTLEICLWDKTSRMEVTLQYAVFKTYDIITRSVKIRNQGDGAIQIKKAMSCCLDFTGSKKFDMLTFYGRHSHERVPQRTTLSHGKLRIDSMRGASSHQQNPFMILCDTDCNEYFGECYSFMLVYSGSFMGQAEVDQISQTRVVMGMQGEHFSWKLETGEEFQCPEVILGYSGSGFQKLSDNQHRLIREHVCRGKRKDDRRPVIINNWEATYFDFDDKKILDIAKSASGLGIEMFVLDDGWFGERNSDLSGLGDWYVNHDKLSCGLKGLTDQINDLGMEFGIWLEPEMVSENSQLYKAHPDWCLHMENRKGVRSRYQYVLDMANPKVVEYLYTSICDILDSANITYVKWDMNRHLSNVRSSVLPTNQQGEVWHRYMLGLYDLLERIVQRYPDLLLETCSGGGGRFDAGMLYYSPQIWCSDNTDAIDRIEIQYGTSFGYPLSTIGAHVSACPNHQTQRNVDMKTRGIVAMSGAFGYELDISILDEEEKDTIKEQILFYKENYSLITNGEYHRLTNPIENREYAAWMIISRDKKEAILTYVQLRSYSNPPLVRLKLKGLKPKTVYQIDKDASYTGEALMNAGFAIPVNYGDNKAFVYKISVM